ncbi:MAG: reverse transcriptase family protein, partial [Spiroplasma ixodetis]|nr:reverse transcriptase family protein [Spiroplasma ixodetis]
LRNHLNSKNSLHQNQFGFTRGKSPELAVNTVISTISSALQSSPFVSVISLDITGAFDHAWWPLIYHRLHMVNPPEYVLSIIHSYLTERSITFNHNATSISRPLVRGCPQGSVLGPTLWNILFNDLLSINLPGASQIFCFADDTLLICRADTVEELTVLTNECLTHIDCWMSNSHLSLNAQKTQACIYTKRKPHEYDSPVFQLKDCVIVPSSTFKYLGLIFDNGFYWAAHLRSLQQRCKVLMHTMSQVCGNLFGYSFRARQIMFLGIVRCLFYYCSSAFYHRLHLKSFQEILTKSIRPLLIATIYGYRTISTPAAHVLADCPPLHLSVIARSLRWLCKNQLPIHSWHSFEKFFLIPGTSPTMYALRDSEETSRCVSEHGLKLFLQEQIYAQWQSEWDNSEKGVTTWFLIPKVEERHLSPLQPNFFLTQALTGHGCFLEYLHRFNLRPNPQCACCCGSTQTSFHILYDCPDYSYIRDPENFSAETNVFSEEFHRTATKIIRALWSQDQSNTIRHRNRYRSRHRQLTLH